MTQIEPVNKKNEIGTILSSNYSVKWTWSIRKLQKKYCSLINISDNYVPKVGDVVIVQVSKIANHTRIYSADNKFSRLYKGDIIIGTLGYRYATDAFHANTIDLSNLHLLTNSGLIGTVESRHTKTREPTQVKIIGSVINNSSYNNINFRENLISSNNLKLIYPPVIFVVGSGMNSGKTTSIARIGKSLVANGFSVSLLKVTGSVSYRDLFEFEAICPSFTSDFSDYGFPSTYMCSKDKLIALFTRMMEDTVNVKPDVSLVEIADGVLQRETQILLQSSIAKSTNIGVILTAPCSCSALTLVEKVKQLGYSPLAVTGLITNSPLFVREFAVYDNTPVIDTKTNVRLLINIISQLLKKS
jgi:hypothetical protein